MKQCSAEKRKPKQNLHILQTKREMNGIYFNLPWEMMCVCGSVFLVLVSRNFHLLPQIRRSVFWAAFRIVRSFIVGVCSFNISVE